MRTYFINKKAYTEDEVITIHRFWQDIQDCDSVNENIELALAMIGDNAISEYVCKNKSKVIERCLQALPDWGVQQDECLSQNCLLLDYLIADKLKELYENYRAGGNMYMNGSESVVFSQSGLTSWGYVWEWAFDRGVELKAPDGHTLMVTDLHSQESERNFEDDLFDCSFSMSRSQDAEWGEICWNCYRLESSIYGMVLESFGACVGQLIRDLKTKNPYVVCLTADEFSDVLAICLDTIRKRLGWSSKKLNWLFNDDGPINATVDEWLTVSLEAHGLQVIH